MNSILDKTLNDEVIEIISSALVTLQKHPEKEEYVTGLIQNAINGAFPKTKCNKIYVNRDTVNSGVPVTCIPTVVSTVLNVRNLTEYSIEINTRMYGDVVDNYTSEEAALFLVHEIIENIITDNTFMRFKSLMVKYMSEKSKNAYNNSRNKSIASLLWISIFSRTKKCLIDNMTNCFFATFIKECLSAKYVDLWNSTIRKYISINGGDPQILTSTYLDEKDKADLITFNKFAREYLSNEHCKYPGEFTRVTKYILATNNSKLLADAIANKPLFSGEFPGKDIYSYFDDTKVIYESAADVISEPSSKSYINRYNELEIYVNNIYSASEKLEVAVKLREFNRDLTIALEKDLLNTDILQSLRSKTNTLIRKLNNIEEKESIIEEFI